MHEHNVIFSSLINVNYVTPIVSYADILGLILFYQSYQYYLLLVNLEFSTYIT